MDHLLLRGDARAIPLPDRSVHCVISSPPYYGLRSYLDSEDPHKSKEIGLEPTPRAYVDSLVGVFREVRRVLRDDGCLWLNLGDSYCNAGSRNNGTGLDGKRRGGVGDTDGTWADSKDTYRDIRHAFKSCGIKHKDLIGIPWMVAFALRDDGWYLRSDIIWEKLNPMPESVTDRPTKAHEYLFLLTKKSRYFYDADAVRQPNKTASNVSDKRSETYGHRARLSPEGAGTREWNNPAGANLRSVLSIASTPLKCAHFATMPPKLVEPCIRAGTSEKGCCPTCGGPWVRVTERGESDYARLGAHNGRDFRRGDSAPGCAGQTRTANGTVPSLKAASSRTVGWRPSCSCPEHDPRPCVIFDPFAGAGTTSVVALALGRRAVGMDLSGDYLSMARRRIERPHAPPGGRESTRPLFAGLVDAPGLVTRTVTHGLMDDVEGLE